jgi:hypothetical protein
VLSLEVNALRRLVMRFHIVRSWCEPCPSSEFQGLAVGSDDPHICIMEDAMRTHRFGRKLKLPSTIAIKHQIRMMMFEDALKNIEAAGGAESGVGRELMGEGLAVAPHLHATIQSGSETS